MNFLIGKKVSMKTHVTKAHSSLFHHSNSKKEQSLNYDYKREQVNDYDQI